jgi:hypothetical protein
MKYFILLFFIASTNMNSYCQILGFRKGLIITQTSDTIPCLVPIASSFGEKVKIKKTEDSKEEEFPLEKIKYLATETNVYENIGYKKNGKEIHKLMWLEEEGKLTLYQEWISTEKGTIKQTGGSVTLYGDPAITYVVKKEDSTYLVEKKHFIEIMKPLIADNTDLVHKLETKAYKYGKLEALVKEYNSSQ